MATQKEKVYGSVRRFGPRYGRKIRFKLSQIEAVYHSKHKCPYCLYAKVERLAVGIWHCCKCDAKFSGKAYSPLHEKLVTEKKHAPAEEVAEEIKEEEEDYNDTEQGEIEQ